MASIYWPSAVAYVAEAGSLQINPRDELARSDFEQGPGRERNRFTQALTDVSFALPALEPADFELFKDFYRTTLLNGSRWFVMRLYQGGGYIGYQVQFIQKYQASDFALVQTKVALSLLVRDFQIPRTEADIWAANQWDPSNPTADELIVDLTNQLHNFLFVTIPKIAARTI